MSMDNPLISEYAFTIAGILDGVPHGVILLDDKLRLVTMNRFLEGLTGYSCADTKGIYADSILRSSLGNRGKIFRQVLATGKSVTTGGEYHKSGPEKDQYSVHSLAFA